MKAGLQDFANRLLFCFVRSLRDLFRPPSHLFAVQQQELLRHGFRNHKHSPDCGL